MVWSMEIAPGYSGIAVVGERLAQLGDDVGHGFTSQEEATEEMASLYFSKQAGLHETRSR